MYLTRIELDTKRYSTMRALQTPSLLYGAIEAAFSGEGERRLWRLDRMGGKQLLLLVSQTQPDLRTLAAQFGVPGQAWETRPYRPLLDQITPGSIWRFRLVADPTKSCSEPTQPQKGFARTCGSVPQQARWLLDRAQKHGFQLTENSFAVTGNKWYLFRKGTTHDSVSLLAVTYEGLLQVTDAEAFRTTLCQGIGHGKAYGMGLLTVIRAQEQGLCASGHSADTTR